jgi:hypothetical protein
VEFRAEKAESAMVVACDRAFDWEGVGVCFRRLQRQYVFEAETVIRTVWDQQVLYRWMGSLLKKVSSRTTPSGKANMQKIERKHLTLRTRIKRLARKTICFSKSKVPHDIVVGLYINRYEFGLAA